MNVFTKIIAAFTFFTAFSVQAAELPVECTDAGKTTARSCLLHIKALTRVARAEAREAKAATELAEAQAKLMELREKIPAKVGFTH